MNLTSSLEKISMPQIEKDITTKQCILSNKWLDVIPNEFVNTRRNLMEYYNLLKFDRTYESSDKYFWDCLSKQRKNVRPIPKQYQSCYWEKISGSMKTTEWTNFLNEVGPDLFFTFDFVLYNNIPIIQDQFWFLIMYLKQLAINIENPFTIIKSVQRDSSYRRLYNKFEQRISSLEVLVKHLFDNKKIYVENNVVIDKTPVTRVTFVGTPISDVPHTNNNINIQSSDKETYVEENKNHNIFIKPYLLCYYFFLPFFKNKIFTTKYVIF